MPDNKQCGYGLAWIGPCPEQPAHENGRCEKHRDLKCSSCGKPATRQCEETMGLVCGCDLCDDCEHQLDPDGTNGRTLAHCKKTEQKYKPWYAQNEQEKADGQRLQIELNDERERRFQEILAKIKNES